MAEPPSTTRLAADVVIDISEVADDADAGVAAPRAASADPQKSPAATPAADRPIVDRPLDGRLAIVTGGTGRIGRAVTEGLVEAGARVCIIGRDLPRLRTALSAAGEDSPLMFLQCDLGSAGEIDGLSDFIERFDRPVDILDHTAGVDVRGAVATGSDDDLDEQYLVKLRCPYLLTQKLQPQLTTAQGHVVFVNSDTALVGRAGDARRAITRFGLRGLADSLRQEVREQGVRVTRVYPPGADDGGVTLGAPDIASSVVHALTLPASVEVTDISLGSPRP